MALDEIERLGPVCDEMVSATGNRNFNFHQEYLKCVLGDLIGKSGADCLLHSQVVAADVLDDRIVCISFEDVEGLFTVKASSFVDATGDANLAHLCGAKTTWGDDSGNVQIATLAFRVCGVDPLCDYSPNAVGAALTKVKADGVTGMTREKILY